MKTATTKQQPSFSLPNVYSDHMVFQRGAPITVAGTASPGYAVKVSFDRETLGAKADGEGRWRVEFPPLPAGTGHAIRVEAPSGAAIELRDVAVGDVWIAGGQSNMEFPVSGQPFYGLKDGAAVAAAANDPDLRILRSQRMVSPLGPCRDLPRGAEWKRADSAAAVGPCSAVGYLFGQLLRRRLGIPVGIVSTNWGGCRIEPWIDEGTFRRHGCENEIALVEAARAPASSAAARRPGRMRAAGRRNLEKWLREKFFASDPKTTKAALSSWAKPGADLSAWRRVPDGTIPSVGRPGVVWFRREVEIPGGWNPKGVKFRAEWINDTDEVFWDGAKIGATWIDTPQYWSAPRDYAVPARLARPGRHVLAVRVANHFASGGMGPASLEGGAGGASIDLASGGWLERAEFAASPKCGTRPPVPVENSSDGYTVPSTLFNAMFAPLSPLRFRGAIWYQGCSNAEEAERYALLQKLLVESWRKATRSPDMAFIQVQLAGFAEHRPTDRLPDDFWVSAAPEENPPWTEMRDTQAKIRSLRLCDLVTAADIGDHSDIHPADKMEVARRLEAAAAAMLYGAKGTATGPSLAAVSREGAALRCSFSDTGAGLVAKPFAPWVRGLVEKTRAAAGKGTPAGRTEFFPEEHAFAVAGADGKWVWAGAKLDGGTVLVFAPEVPEPVRVRYAWSKFCPSMRLFNKAGFPAFPFQGAAKR